MIKQLITSALESVRNEEGYLECFNRLVILHETRKQGKVLSPSTLEEEFSSKFNITAIPIKNTSKAKGKRKCSKAVDVHSPDNKEQNVIDGDNRNRNKGWWIPKLKGQLSDRILIREKILVKLNSMLDENEEFETLLDELIDVEESFVEEEYI